MCFELFKRYGFYASVLAVVIAVSVVIAFGTSVSEGGKPPPPDRTPSPPEEDIFPTPTPFDARAFIEKARKEGKVHTTIGPTTKGATLEIAGKEIKLPEDVYIGARADGGICIRDCPEFPFYKLVRGKSSIWVDAAGDLRREKTAPGEERAFDFLREALGK